MAYQYNKKTEMFFLLGVSILFLILTFFIIKDIISLIIYSVLLSYFLYPLFKYYNSKIKNERIASVVTLSSSIIILFIPFILLSYFLILSLIKLVVEYKVYIENPELLNIVISEFIQKITNSEFLSSISFSDMVTTLVSFIVDLSKNFFSSMPIIITYFFIVMFITYYILIYNKRMLKAANDYIPLSLKKQNKIISQIEKNVKVLFKGYFLTGLIQTLVALFGYIIFGAPNVLILTFITLFASLIPYLGTPLVWVPTGIYMIINGHEIAGIWLLIYGALIINLVDNFVRPFLMSNKDTIPPALIFIGFVGGLIAFGIVGIILGPLIISITAILLKCLKETYDNQ